MVFLGTEKVIAPARPVTYLQLGDQASEGMDTTYRAYSRCHHLGQRSFSTYSTSFISDEGITLVPSKNVIRTFNITTLRFPTLAGTIYLLSQYLLRH